MTSANMFLVPRMKTDMVEQEAFSLHKMMLLFPPSGDELLSCCWFLKSTDETASSEPH